jgi:hypothetical protein
MATEARCKEREEYIQPARPLNSLDASKGDVQPLGLLV